MNKLYFFALISLCCLNLKSQSVTFEMKSTSTGSSMVADGSTFYRSTAPSANVKHYFDIKNISASTQTFLVRRYDDMLNTVTPVTDVASAYFCTGLTCYDASVFTANFTLSAGANISITTDLDEASIIGQSNVRYKVSNSADATDKIITTIQYNGPVSVKESNAVLSSISGVYPNPSSSKCYIDILAGVNMNAGLSILNMLGSIISSKQIELDKGKNKILIDSENLESGIYFVSISHGNSKIIKKITVTK